MEKLTLESAAKFKSLHLDLTGEIAQIRFTRPEKANAMSRDFWQEFPLAIDILSELPEMRVLVLSAEGKHFSSGMDLSVFSNNESLQNSSSRERERLRRLIVNLQNVISRLEQLRCPVIAAIQGACIGAALDLVSACDIRLASSEAYFCIQEINLAMMPDLGVLQRLPKLIPEGIVRELAFTGDRLTAERALRIGLVNNIYPDKEEMISDALQLASRIKNKSPLAVAGSKESLNYSRNKSIEDALNHSAILQSSIIDIRDIEIAARAASSKNEASFSPRLGQAEL